MAKNLPHASQREVGAALNNALLLARDTAHFQAFLKDKGAERDLKRKQRLRAYTEAHVQVIKEHLDEGLLHVDEAVLILVGEAVLIAGLFYRGVKLPVFADLAKSLMDDGTEVGE